MERNRLGRTTLEITPIGFGAWAIGGAGYEFGWGPQDDARSIEAIERAIELGVNWIDTAPVYGLGHSERIVGQALKGRADRPLLFTKCSVRWDGEGRIRRTLAADSIRKECEESLERLGVESIDLYQIHRPIPEDEIEEGWEAMVALKEQGLVRHIGVSNVDVAQMRRLDRIAPVETLQPPYSLIRRGIEDTVLPHCLENGIGVLAYSPMASGLLTGAMTRERVRSLPADDWRNRSAAFREPALSRNLALAELLATIGKRHGRSAGEVAIAWVLRHRAVTAAIVGGRSAAQVSGTARASDLELTDEEVREIEGFGEGSGR